MTPEPSEVREQAAGAPREGAPAGPAADAGPADATTDATAATTAGRMPNEAAGREEPAAEEPVGQEPAPETPGAGAAEEAGRAEDVDDDLARARTDLAELTGDLQRLQAEFLNYKRRVDRDRDLIRENATYAALAPITEVLDTIDRAREHGPLEGGFKAVADQLERVVTRLGLTKFGAVGDPFDPTIHEALSHIGEDPDVDVTTCKVVAKAGYRIGDRVVRAAQVLVVDPPSERPEPVDRTGPSDQAAATADASDPNE